MSEQHAESIKRGSVLCFASVKGGSGKTTLALNTAYGLMQANKSVVLVDTDSATRGLSMLCLAQTASFRHATKEQSLSSAWLCQIPPDKMETYVVERRGGLFPIILATQSASDTLLGIEELLGLVKFDVKQEIGVTATTRSFEESGFISTSDRKLSPAMMDYWRFYSALIDHLATKFDFVVVDTRGGADFTSIFSSLKADRCMLVLEHDMVSDALVPGFVSKRETYSRELAASIEGYAGVQQIHGIIFNRLHSLREETGSSVAGITVLGKLTHDHRARACFADFGVALHDARNSDFAFQLGMVLTDLASGKQAVDEIRQPLTEYLDIKDKKNSNPNWRKSVREWAAARQRNEDIARLLPRAIVVALLLVGLAVMLDLFFMDEGVRFRFSFGATAILVCVLFTDLVVRFVKQMRSSSHPWSPLTKKMTWGTLSIAAIMLAVAVTFLPLRLPELFKVDENEAAAELAKSSLWGEEGIELGSSLSKNITALVQASNAEHAKLAELVDFEKNMRAEIGVTDQGKRLWDQFIKSYDSIKTGADNLQTSLAAYVSWKVIGGDETPMIQGFRKMHGPIANQIDVLALNREQMTVLGKKLHELALQNETLLDFDSKWPLDVVGDVKTIQKKLTDAKTMLVEFQGLRAIQEREPSTLEKSYVSAIVDFFAEPILRKAPVNGQGLGFALMAPFLDKNFVKLAAERIGELHAKIAANTAQNKNLVSPRDKEVLLRLATMLNALCNTYPSAPSAVPNQSQTELLKLNRVVLTPFVTDIINWIDALPGESRGQLKTSRGVLEDCSKLISASK